MGSYSFEEIIQHRNTWQGHLLTGNFHQGTGTLVKVASVDPDCGCKTVKYCCLGVAFEVAGRELPEPIYNVDNTYFGSNTGSQYTSSFNDEMMEYMGFAQWMVDILVNLNDNGVNFSMIEEVIDAFPVLIDGEYHDSH